MLLNFDPLAEHRLVGFELGGGTLEYDPAVAHHINAVRYPPASRCFLAEISFLDLWIEERNVWAVSTIASALFQSVSQPLRSSLAPCIQTLLKPTVCLPLMRRYT